MIFHRLPNKKREKTREKKWLREKKRETQANAPSVYTEKEISI